MIKAQTQSLLPPFIFSASYADRGDPVVGSQTAAAAVNLRSAKFRAAGFDFEEKTLFFVKLLRGGGGKAFRW